MKRSRRATAADKEHMGRVAELPCLACLHDEVVSFHDHGPVEIHHIRATAGIGQRSKHTETLPLCPRHHRLGGLGTAIHAGQKTWESIYGTELALLEDVRGLLR